MSIESWRKEHFGRGGLEIGEIDLYGRSFDIDCILRCR